MALQKFRIGIRLDKVVDQKPGKCRYSGITLLYRSFNYAKICAPLRAYIIGSKVLIKTDHKSSEWIKQSKVLRLVRWAFRLEEFNYEIEYQPGKYDKSADALSRLVGENTTETIKHRKYPGKEAIYDLTSQELLELNTMGIYKKEGLYREKFKEFQLLDKIIQKIVEEDPDQNSDVKDYINSCELCLKIKTRAPIKNGILRPIETKRPFELIGIDIAYLLVSNSDIF